MYIVASDTLTPWLKVLSLSIEGESDDLLAIPAVLDGIPKTIRAGTEFSQAEHLLTPAVSMPYWTAPEDMYLQQVDFTPGILPSVPEPEAPVESLTGLLALGVTLHYAKTPRAEVPAVPDGVHRLGSPGYAWDIVGGDVTYAWLTLYSQGTAWYNGHEDGQSTVFADAPALVWMEGYEYPPRHWRYKGYDFPYHIGFQDYGRQYLFYYASELAPYHVFGESDTPFTFLPFHLAPGVRPDAHGYGRWMPVYRPSHAYPQPGDQPPGRPSLLPALVGLALPLLTLAASVAASGAMTDQQKRRKRP